MIDRYRRWKARRRQRTFVYCPSCKFELVAGGEWLGHDVTDPRLEAYRCARCGWLSVWDFDAPCPLLVESDAITAGRLSKGRQSDMTDRGI